MIIWITEIALTLSKFRNKIVFVPQSRKEIAFQCKMSVKISVPCAVLCVLTLCYGHENTTLPTSTQSLATTVTATATTVGESMESNDSASDEWISNDKDLDQDATIWRFWRPFRKL
ncbi:hypothetical protein SFRURICE_020795, partial [Spodoptera frugiperda]